ncbi:mechanosensitive ion channel family protein [Oceanobacillus sp. FSL H7-0719]|uniref:mechanosensitive ion channel family protein n=1 Tax=Oceanobacillus sp. FSL H7-0719 TaxID=2954507 RepID=UPI00386E88D1
METLNFFISQEHLKHLGIAIGIFLLFLLFRKLFTKYIFKIIMRMINKTRINFLSNIFRSFQKPVEWLFIIIGIYLAVRAYPYLNHENELFEHVMKSSIIILAAWGLFNLSSSSSTLFYKINEKTNLKIDEILIPLLSKALQFIIVAITLTIVLQEFDYNIEGFIAGLGLGGLAISLAAKDALANMVGGIVLISEKPFTIGDWILTPSVEGTVEEISFRSTRVRTFADALVTVPNAILGNENITNWSKMGKRQVNFTLKLVYDTPTEKVRRVVDRIETLVKEHEGVHPETIFVKFDQYQDNGLEILLYFFTKTTVWAEYLQVKEDINYKIYDILTEERVEIAVPTRRLKVESEEMMPNGKENTEES